MSQDPFDPTQPPPPEFPIGPDGELETVEDHDRRVDTITRDRITHIEERAKKFFRNALLIIAALGFLNALSLGGFGYELYRNQQQGDRNKREARATSQSIQGQRYLSIKKVCEAQNEQNKGILDALKQFKVKNPTILDNFPIEPNCDKFASRQVHPPPAPPTPKKKGQ